MDMIPGEECFQVLVGIKCRSLQAQELMYLNRLYGLLPKAVGGDEDPRGDGDFEQTADCCGPVSVVADRDEELERFNERKSAKGVK